MDNDDAKLLSYGRWPLALLGRDIEVLIGDTVRVTDEERVESISS